MLVNIDDLRTRAKRRLPRAVFDYIDGGAEDEWSVRLNRTGFQRYTFRPRMLVDVSQRDISTSVLGQQLSSPIVLAPTGLCGMAAPRGELLAARAAARHGAVFTISSMSSVALEEVARATTGPKWFQLYVWKDRGLTRSLVERAQAAGYRALALTVDVQTIGQRERDIRNGAVVPPRITLANVLDAIPKLPYFAGMLRHPSFTFANVENTNRAKGESPVGIAQYVLQQMDPGVTWADIDWLRSFWSGPIAIKGLMSAEDAKIAVEHCVEGIIVSNHGGRQLDGLPGAVEVLPEIVDAVAGRADVILDGGIRRGTDVIKAIALGARACMLGRPYLYGLGAAGQAGCELAIEILHKEIDRNLGLLGCPRLSDLDRSYLRLDLPHLPG